MKEQTHKFKKFNNHKNSDHMPFITKFTVMAIRCRPGIILNKTRKGRLALKILIELHKLFYLFHPSVNLKLTIFQLLLLWSNPKITIPITKFLSIFQLASSLKPEKNLFETQTLIDFQLSRTEYMIFARSSMLFFAIPVFFIFSSLRNLSKFKISDNLVIQLKRLMIFRLFISEIIFFPVLETVLSGLECTNYQGVEGLRSKADRSIACYYSHDGSLGNIFWSLCGFFTLSYQIILGCWATRVYDINPLIQSRENNPR